MKEVPPGIICYWKYEKVKESAKSRARRWILVEAYAHDLDGYPLTKPVNTDGDNYQYMDWLMKDEEGLTYDEREPIPGRAVTHWSVEYGVTLMGFSPPEANDWLSQDFFKKLKKKQNWHEMLECGADLFLGTARAVERILEGKPKPAA